MGICSGKPKKEIENRSIEKTFLSKHKITEETQITRNCNNLQTPDPLPEQKQLNQKNSKQDLYKESKEQIFKIKMHKLPLTKYYSVLAPMQNYSKSSNRKIVQHNLTGKMKDLEILGKIEEENEKLIEQLKTYNLSHPNLIQLHEIFQDPNNYYMIYDYCNEGILQGQKINPELPEEIVLIILHQILQVLEYLHKNKIYPKNLSHLSFSLQKESDQLYVKYADIKGLFYKDEEQLVFQKYRPIETSQQQQNSDPNYQQKQNLWSIGILGYYLLTGEFPFDGNNKSTVISAIKRGVIDFNTIKMDKISQGTKELLQSLLKQHVQNRIGIKEALNHKCFAQAQKKYSQSKSLVIQQNKIQNISILQSLFLQFMIKQYYSDQQQKIYRMFDEFDINKDGKLNKLEMIEAYKSQLDSPEEAIKYVDQIFEMIDIDNSGDIDFNEFIIATTDKSALLTKTNLRACFKMMANSSGFVTPQRLSTFFVTKKQQVKEYFSQYKPDNKINYKEFEEIMLPLV